jgi:hypothetical protein
MGISRSLFQQAAINAQLRLGSETFSMMTAKEQAQAIYAEMRRLDLAASRLRSEAARTPVTAVWSGGSPATSRIGQDRLNVQPARRTG